MDLREEILTIPEATKSRIETIIRHGLRDGTIGDYKALEQGHARFFTKEDADKIRATVIEDLATRTDEDRERARAMAEILEKGRAAAKAKGKSAELKKSHHKAKTEPESTVDDRTDDKLTPERIMREPGPKSTRKSLLDKKPKGEDDVPNKKSSLKWLFIVGGGLVLVGALFFAWKARQKQRQPGQAPMSPQGPAAAPPPVPLAEPFGIEQHAETDDAVAREYARRMGMG
jgi:hypothetical protein